MRYYKNFFGKTPSLKQASLINMDNIKIRPLAGADLQTITAIHSRVLPTLSAKIGTPYLRLLYETLLRDRENHLLLVACAGRKVAGCLTASCNLEKTQQLLADLKFHPRLWWPVTQALLTGRLKLNELIDRLRFESFLYNSFPGPYMTILTLFVDTGYQHQGIGPKLLDSGLRLLPQDRRLYVDTRTNNLPARRWYEKHDFRKERVAFGNIIYVRKTQTTAKIRLNKLTSPPR